MSIIGFISMAIDKQAASSGRWRVAEGKHRLIAFAGGAAGIWIGMVTFRHKTSRSKSYYSNWVKTGLIINVVMIIISITS